MCEECKQKAAWWQLLKSAKRLQRLLAKHNFNPSQPRIPRGDRDGGRWTRANGASEGAIAAATREEKNRCIEDCHRILERFKIAPGVDYNEFDFRRCLNACLEQFA